MLFCILSNPKHLYVSFRLLPAWTHSGPVGSRGPTARRRGAAGLGRTGRCRASGQEKTFLFAFQQIVYTVLDNSSKAHTKDDQCTPMGERNQWLRSGLSRVDQLIRKL